MAKACRAAAEDSAENSGTKRRQASIVWRPNSLPQRLFLQCPYWEAFFGGARGPGKTDCLLMDFAQHVGVGFGIDWRGIIFRKTYKQLDEIIDRSKKWFTQIFPGAEYRKGDYEWSFVDGESLKFRHLERKDDAQNYQGHQFTFIGFEELGNWADLTVYEMLKACCRSTNPHVPKKIRSTGNPLGVGHNAVKAYFIDPAPPMTPIVNEQGMSRIFIPGHVYDNVDLVDNNPEYIKLLESITDDNLRRAWLYGDWDVVAGSFFGDLWKRERHVIQPFAIPSGWYVDRGFDWGSATPSATIWFAESDGTEAPDGRIYPRGALIVFAEYYTCGSEPNTGLRMISSDVAREIKRRDDQFQQKFKVRVRPGPADPAIFKSDDGPSIADAMAKCGVSWSKADNARIPGWERLRQMLAGNVDGQPMIYFFSTCTNVLRTLPTAPRDERIWDDIDTDCEDHLLDVIRYRCMGRKRSGGPAYVKW